MKNLMRLAAISVLLFSGCVQQSTSPTNQTSEGSGDAAFKKVHDEYVVEFLRRNPTVNTYLGGAVWIQNFAKSMGRCEIIRQLP